MNRTRILAIASLLMPVVAGAGALDVYGSLTGKTVLAPAALPLLSDSIVPDSLADTNKAIAAIETALAEKGLEVVQDGPHFVRVFRKGSRDSTTNAPLRGAELALAKGQEALPTGAIDFSSAELRQVLDIYALLRRRTVLRSATLPAPVVHLKTTCPLTQEEVVYALETVLALNGICVADDGAKFVQVVPMAQKASVKTDAPKPEPSAKLFEPKRMPAMGISSPPGVPVPPRPPTDMERLEQEFERLRKVVCDFLHIKEPNKHSPQRLLELYARLADKSAVASTNFDRVPIYFQVETPVTRTELLYAIQTTMTLNNLAIIPVDDRRIRLGWIGEVFRRNGEVPERAQRKK